MCVPYLYITLRNPADPIGHSQCHQRDRIQVCEPAMSSARHTHSAGHMVQGWEGDHWQGRGV